MSLQYVKIVPYLRLLTKMFSSAADIKSIEMNYSVDIDDESIVQIDPHQFEKIIYNLHFQRNKIYARRWENWT